MFMPLGKAQQRHVYLLLILILLTHYKRSKLLFMVYVVAHFY